LPKENLLKPFWEFFLENVFNMTLMNNKKFRDWDAYYKENKVEGMPWYNVNLDSNLENYINANNLHGGKFLDLGTGPGTQAIQLEQLGFDVTGTDISENAIIKARKLASKVRFLTDDFLNSKLADKEFNYIFDRGCFHVFDDEQRKSCVKQYSRILSDDGILFVKCMSVDEQDLPEDEGPHRFSKKEIIDSFSSDFEILDIETGVFIGTLEKPPKAWFVVMKKNN